MIIAVPIASGVLCSHFGHCESFAVMDVDRDGAIITKKVLDPPPHEPGLLPVWLHSLGVQHVIAGGMGSRAQGIFYEHGISVTVGAPTGTPEELALSLVKGTLTGGDNVCDH